ncbi:hypothetical protein JCM8097_006096 [Rhodosporidiobolus ruineniae]
MSSSASPASSTGGGATDEDQHGEEREEGLKPSLFRLLPSEVISHILLLAEADNMPAPLLPFSFDDDRDSVVRCSHHRFLILDGLTDRQPILDLASKGDEQLAVRRLLYAPTDDPVALEYQCAILRSLKNLRHFEIEFDERVPRLITALFASFQHLTSLRLVTELKFGDSWPLEDQSFSIGRDLPSLERFEAYPKSPLPQLLSTPCPNLKYLDVFIDTHERESFDWLPWSSLTSLTLFLTDSTTKSVKPLRFLSSSLQKALVPAEGDQQASALPLRRLHINNIAFFSSEYDRGNVTSAAAKAFFDVLRPLQLVSLSIELSVKLCAPWHGTALPSVRSLHLLMMGLEDPQPWRHDIPKRLSSIIVCFSTVETTFLDCVDFSGSMGDEDSPDSFDFMLERPFLFALVSFVKRSTSVVRFDWRPYDCAPLLYRWTRSNRDEDFCGERYREF